MSKTHLFKVIADKQRRDILEILRGGPLCAGEIAEKIGITPAALSYHLKLLRESDLVVEYKSKNYVFYEVNTSVLEDLILWAKQFVEGKNEN